MITPPALLLQRVALVARAVFAALALGALAALTALAGCRADAAPADPALLDDWESPAGFFPEPLPGPDPYVAGTDRLGLGLFYEGGLSEFMPIDGSTSNYYIFEAFPGDPLTYGQLEDKARRVEGLVSARITHAGLTFWGGGIFWSSPRNVSRWQTLHVSLRSTAPSFAEISLGVKSANREFRVNATDYGYANDGEWHHLVIPLADFAEDGADFAALDSPFLFGGGAGQSGDFFNIDNLYWTTP